MNFKVFFAFFVTLLTIHASTQSPLQDDSIKEIVVLVFGEILKVTQSALDTANQAVDSFEKNQEAITKQLVDLAVAEGKKLNKDFLAIVDQLNDGATSDGKAVIKCIDAEEDKTDAAFKETATALGKCAGGEVSVVSKELKVVLGQLGDLQTDVQGQVNTLKACSKDELTCLEAFLSTALVTLKKIPTVVQDDLKQIVQLAQQVVADMKKCEIIKSVEKNIQEIFNEAVVCIKKN